MACAQPLGRLASSHLRAAGRDHPAVLAPSWELVWELSSLHTHWLGAYHPDQHGSAPIGWHTDFALSRDRLREWVAMSGTKLDRDRPTRQTAWPGETDPTPADEEVIGDRDADFVNWVHGDVVRRSALQDARESFVADESPTSVRPTLHMDALVSLPPSVLLPLGEPQKDHHEHDDNNQDR